MKVNGFRVIGTAFIAAGLMSGAFLADSGKSSAESELGKTAIIEAVEEEDTAGTRRLVLVDHDPADDGHADEDGGDQTGHDEDGGDRTGHDEGGGDQTGHDKDGGDQTGHDEDGGDQTGHDVEQPPAPVEPTPAPVEPTPAPVEPTPAPTTPSEPTPAEDVAGIQPPSTGDGGLAGPR